MPRVKKFTICFPIDMHRRLSEDAKRSRAGNVSGFLQDIYVRYKQRENQNQNTQGQDPQN